MCRLNADNYEIRTNRSPLPRLRAAPLWIESPWKMKLNFQEALMLQESETATPVRVTYDEARLIRPGFRRLISAHYRWKERGSSPISPARGRAIPISDPKDEGEFSPEWQAIILHVAVVATNNFKAQSRRLHLNRVELAACIVGVRATEMMARHGHLEPKPTDFKVRCRRLLKKLERLRKRAKRAYIRVHGRAAFKRASQPEGKCSWC